MSNDDTQSQALENFYASLDAIAEGLSEVEGKLGCVSKIPLNNPGTLTQDEPLTTTPNFIQSVRSNADRLTAIERDIMKTGEGIDELTHDVANAVELADSVTGEFHNLAQQCVELMQENNRLRKVIAEMGHRQMEELTQMRSETDEMKSLLEERLSQEPIPLTPSLEALVPMVLPFVQQALLSIVACDSQPESDWPHQSNPTME